MRVNTRYVTEFTIKSGKIRSSQVINSENANLAEQAAINSAKSLVAAFVRSRLTNDQDCVINIRVRYVETARGLELTFRV